MIIAPELEMVVLSSANQSWGWSQDVPSEATERWEVQAQDSSDPLPPPPVTITDFSVMVLTRADTGPEGDKGRKSAVIWTRLVSLDRAGQCLQRKIALLDQLKLAGGGKIKITATHLLYFLIFMVSFSFPRNLNIFIVPFRLMRW